MRKMLSIHGIHGRNMADLISTVLISLCILLLVAEQWFIARDQRRIDAEFDELRRKYEKMRTELVDMLKEYVEGDMGTNIYIQRKEPRMVPEYDQVHIAKLSYGWKAHFDGGSRASWDYDSNGKPSIGSMDDLRAYLATGDWELVDEDGDKVSIEDVLAHDAYIVDGELVNTRISMDDYYDREGHPWSKREFC